MHIFKRIIVIAVALLVVLATAVFMLENRQPVTLVFFGWATPELSQAVPVVLALLLGMLVGPFLAWLASLRKKRVRSARSIQ
ncbi:lipopolysaccharide assembly protein LapA domain-containing protein [Pseudomonas capsici]|uniref:lipopolysaccharide assembly protein LapA domain-containing protein n=1 Tax=Pseudomonas capsici TaxID=2810614 RepID=UPI0021F212E7|nr:lipopolysaccharide assembly protein LapA domain-containing protein [Pseudomonas capsici]MCV4342358.1 lipopolysaccharide assembly protein LapA domain-containing protein [Pseudomonas capsici]